jgi:hypothetical protein
VSRRGGAWLGALALAVVAGGCLSPLVGAECREGALECGGVCVDPASDPDNCGGCGVVCDGACVEGVCAGDFPGGCDDVNGCPREPEAGANPDHGSLTDGGGELEVGPICQLGELACGEACVDADSDPDHCGGCGVDCGDGVCSDGVCAERCEAPMELCGAACLDLDSDPDNCGGCGVVCDSGLCAEGVCTGAIAGHLVVIGHDYGAHNPAMQRVLGNAVFLAGREQIRVLAFDARATAAVVGGTDASIDQAAGALGASWSKEAMADPAAVSFRLAHADVFLVYAQPVASDAELAAWGETWQLALAQFGRRGGVIVVLDGAGDHGGTARVLEAAGLFTVGHRAAASSSTVQVVAPTDAVARQVPVQYRAEPTSVSVGPQDGAVVITAGGDAVVVHRAIL